MRLFFVLFVMASLGCAVQVAADGQDRPPSPLPRDVWLPVTEASPFYSAQTAAFPMAAVVLSGGGFARIILGEDGAGAYVTVNLPGTAPATGLRSDLVYSNGAYLTRDVMGAELEAQVMTASQSVTYSFSIAAEDIRAFRAAVRWSVTPENGAPVDITLTGSAKAIRKALSAPRPVAHAEHSAQGVPAHPDIGALPSPPVQ